jgi:VanZ family protein
MSSLGYGSALVLFVAGLFLILLFVSAEKFSLHHGAGVLMLVLAVFIAALARGLRAFRPWARTGAIVMSFAGLLAVPLGTFLCGPFLYVLLKSKHLFTPQPVVPVTPPADIDRLAA